MAYSATAYKVMIASPSDVAKERQFIREVVLEWNYINSEDRRIVLMPVGWETHSSPMMGTRPQEVINKQVLSGCDLLVAAFWTRNRYSNSNICEWYSRGNRGAHIGRQAGQ